MYWYLILIIILLICYRSIYKQLNFWKKRGIPYLKPILPIIGNLSPFILGQTSFFHLVQRIYKSLDKRYFGITVFSNHYLVIKDSDLVKNITVKDFDHFVDHKNLFSESNESVIVNNLFASRGQRWRELRVTLSPAFTGSKMRSMFVLVSECAQRFTNYFDKESKNNKIIEVELKDTYKRLTIDLIASCVFGLECNSLEEKNNEFFINGNETANFTGIRAIKMIGFMISPSVMRFLGMRVFPKKQVDFFQNIVSQTIEYREKNNIIRPDLIHLMMQAKKGQLKYEESAKLDDTGFATIEESNLVRNTKTNLEITDDLVVAQAILFFVGGVDTTSTLLSFISYELALNPDIQKRLQEEIDSVHEKCNGKVTYEAIAEMKYLDMVVCETLRKWPQGFFQDRLCVKDYTIEPTQPGESSYTVKKGDVIWIPSVGYHLDPKHFPDPERFDPERFSDENKRNIKPYTYMPFGMGPRSCIGNRFALLVTKGCLFHILQKFNFVVTNKTDIPLKLSKVQIIINAVNGFWIGFEKR